MRALPPPLEPVLATWNALPPTLFVTFSGDLDAAHGVAAANWIAVIGLQRFTCTSVASIVGPLITLNMTPAGGLSGPDRFNYRFTSAPYLRGAAGEDIAQVVGFPVT